MILERQFPPHAARLVVVHVAEVLVVATDNMPRQSAAVTAASTVAVVENVSHTQTVQGQS